MKKTPNFRPWEPESPRLIIQMNSAVHKEMLDHFLAQFVINDLLPDAERYKGEVYELYEKVADAALGAFNPGQIPEMMTELFRPRRFRKKMTVVYGQDCFGWEEIPMGTIDIPKCPLIPKGIAF